jgi:hypothetical protein
MSAPLYWMIIYREIFVRIIAAIAAKIASAPMPIFSILAAVSF